MTCYLRKAKMDDCDLLFEWTNYPMVRQNSFFTKPITYDEHVNWFRNIMERKDCVQYIYMEGDKPIGQARIQICDDMAEISYSIIPQKQSLGHGHEILSAICDEVWREFPNVTKVVGKVKPDNIASQKAFEKAGYDEVCRVYEIKKYDIYNPN